MSNTTNNMLARLSGPIRRLVALVVVVALSAGLAQVVLAQEDIDDAKAQREATREAELRARAALDVLDAEFVDVQAAFDAADELVRLAEERAVQIETSLELAQARLARTEVGLAWAEYDRETIADQVADLAIREYLGVADEDSLLDEPDLNEALARNALIEAVQGAGLDVIDTARASADQFTMLGEQVLGEIAEVERLTLELEAELEELEAAREVRERARDTLEGRRQEWLDRIDEIDAEEARLTDFIQAEQARIEAEEALAAARAAQPSEDGYVWPTAGGIGSYFGWRLHPVLGYERLHGGLDIGGLMGQPIWATRGGVVILAGVNGGYGNAVIIDHGGGVATLYGHMSTFAVRQGDVVEQGQQIGAVGSTGLSTGPHLHFEIRIDGGVVDPLPYLPPR